MYKDIVVYINESEGRDNTIRAAARFASEVNARLRGVYVRVNLVPALPPYGVISQELAEQVRKEQDQRLAVSEKLFNKIASEHGCEHEWVELNGQQDALRVATYSDLVLTNQVSYDLHQSQSNLGFVNRLILESGKPVVLIPANWNETEFGSRVLLGWDESRAATRALQDSMPLLKKADYVEAVCVNSIEPDDPADVSDVSDFLVRRNVTNTFKLMVTDEYLDTTEKVLHDYACRSSANLIVIGGYGHSRLREIILGGVTRYLLKNSRVPVLFSH